jgi:hypothetical protein
MESEDLRLRARVEELERRLEDVEQRLGIRTPPPLPVVIRSEPEPAPEPPPPLRQEPPADTVETKAGLVWVNRIGAVTVILSVAFGFKYAVDNEWIGPSGRVMLGLLAGALALLAGDKLWWRGHKSFAQGITALGVSIFYLSFYAAYQLYSLIPQSVAFLGAVVTTLAGGALALRYDARAIATLALFGGYLSPALASSGQPNDRFFGAYLFVLNAIALTLVRRKQWLGVEIAAAAATLIFVTAWIDSAGHRLDPVEGSLFVTLQFAVFVLSPFLRIRMLAPVPAMVGIAVVCEVYSSPAYWTWAAIVSVIGVGVAWRDRDDRLLAPSFAGWAIGLLAWSPYWISHGALFAGLTAGFLGYFAATDPSARRCGAITGYVHYCSPPTRSSISESAMRGSTVSITVTWACSHWRWRARISLELRSSSIQRSARDDAGKCGPGVVVRDARHSDSTQRLQHHARLGDGIGGARVPGRAAPVALGIRGFVGHRRARSGHALW